MNNDKSATAQKFRVEADVKFNHFEGVWPEEKHADSGKPLSLPPLLGTRKNLAL